MKAKIPFLYFALFFLVISSCKKKDDDECPACPSVHSISPANGKYGDEVTISGVNFNSNYPDNIIKFNGKIVDAADIISGSTTELKVKVPKGCGTGPVTVDVDADLTNTGTAPIFNYEYTKTVSVFAGQEGNPANPSWPVALDQPQFNYPSDVLVDNDGVVYVLELNEHVKKLDTTINMFTAITGVTAPKCFFLDKQNNLYICENAGNIYRILKCAAGTFFAMVYKEMTISQYGLSVSSACIDNELNIYAAIPDTQDPISRVVIFPNIGGDSVLFTCPMITNMKLRGSYIYASVNSWDGIHMLPSVIRANTHTGLQNTLVTTLNCSTIGLIRGLCLNDNMIFISDGQGGYIYSINASGLLNLVMPIPFNLPDGLAFDSNQNLFIAESQMHCIKKVVFE